MSPTASGSLTWLTLGLVITLVRVGRGRRGYPRSSIPIR
jgi:hypothetical protein